MGPGLLCLRTRSPHPGTKYEVAFGAEAILSLNVELYSGHCGPRTIMGWIKELQRGGKKWCKCVCLQGSKGSQPCLRTRRPGEGTRSLTSVLCPKAAPSHVPTRPGSCAGVGAAALFSSSQDLPDDVLLFIKAHPLLDPAVPPATHQPLLTLTSR